MIPHKTMKHVMDILKDPLFTIFNSECQVLDMLLEWNNASWENDLCENATLCQKETLLAFIIAFKKLFSCCWRKRIEDSNLTEQVFYSTESTPEFNKLMKSVSISGFILHIGEK